MTMGVYIPSLGRATAQNIAAGPLADMSPDMRRRATYVVPTYEAEAYSVLLQPYEAAVVGCDERGIANTRRWIGEFAESAGERHFAMMDDDIRFLYRRGDDDWRLRGIEDTSESDRLFETIEQLLGDGFGHVGVSAREGNNRIGVGEAPLLAENTRTLRFLCYQTGEFLRCEHGRVQVMEDFDVNLQLLERGLPNCSIHYWAQGQKMTNAPGGCSTYRSHEVHEASARRLQELHPGVVSLRQKRNKTDADGFGTRTEVTIQWKRAFNGH